MLFSNLCYYWVSFYILFWMMYNVINSFINEKKLWIIGMLLFLNWKCILYTIFNQYWYNLYLRLEETLEVLLFVDSGYIIIIIFRLLLQLNYTSDILNAVIIVDYSAMVNSCTYTRVVWTWHPMILCLRFMWNE